MYRDGFVLSAPFACAGGAGSGAALHGCLRAGAAAAPALLLHCRSSPSAGPDGDVANNDSKDADFQMKDDATLPCPSWPLRCCRMPGEDDATTSGSGNGLLWPESCSVLARECAADEIAALPLLSAAALEDALRVVLDACLRLPRGVLALLQSGSGLPSVLRVHFNAVSCAHRMPRGVSECFLARRAAWVSPFISTKTKNVESES